MLCARGSARVDPRNSTSTRANSSRPMPSLPACSQPTFGSALMSAGARSTTFSAYADGAASEVRTSSSTSMTRSASYRPVCAHSSTIAHPPKSTLYSDGGRQQTSEYTFFFLFRGPEIGARHAHYKFHECGGAFHSRTMKRSSPSTKSGSVPLWRRIESMIRLRTPIP